MPNPIYILYGSQTGNSEVISDDIYTLLKNKGYECVYSSLNKSIKNESFSFLENTEEETFVIIVCSTTGNGDAPENANKFWRKIKDRNLPKKLLCNINYTVLGLGNTNYSYFCQMGKLLDKRLYELGGKRIQKLYCADDVSNFEETVEEFKESIVSYITNHL